MVKNTKNLLAVVIITKNEAHNVVRCLQSAKKVADEIVVVDSFSTDETEAVCRREGIKFFQKEWQGYAQTKNWANQQASFNWILSLDADEALSPQLQQEILNLKDIENLQNFTYSINRQTNYCGKWIKHCGWFPDEKIRLFDRHTARWVGDFVHETLETDAGIVPQKLNGICYHFSYNSIEDHAKRVNRYSTLAAQKRFSEGKKPSVAKLIFSPWAKFFSTYFIKKGFLDGKEGFFIAVISAYMNFLREAKLFYLWKNKN